MTNELAVSMIKVCLEEGLKRNHEARKLADKLTRKNRKRIVKLKDEMVRINEAVRSIYFLVDKPCKELTNIYLSVLRVDVDIEKLVKALEEV